MLRGLSAAVVVAGALAVGASAATTPLAGTYETKLSGTPVALLNATWDVRFEASGRYVIKRNGATVVVGKWHRVPHVAGQIGLSDVSGPAACPGTSAAATYVATFRKSSAKRVYLVLKPAHDSCAGRSAVLSTRPLLETG